MHINFKLLLIFIFSIFVFSLKVKESVKSNKIISISLCNNEEKYYVGNKYKIDAKIYPNSTNEKILFNFSNKKIVELLNDYILMKSSGRECLTAFTKQINSTFCFNIYQNPELIIKENNTIRLETNSFKQLNLFINDNIKNSKIKYVSSHPEIIKVNKYGKIFAMRPGRAIITVTAFYNNNSIEKVLNILSISNNGLITKNTLSKYKADQYKNVMIVSHPDDETLWGGAHLIRDKYFVVCLTNGYNVKRANDFRELLAFTNNSGIILNYPDLQDNIKDNWSGVRNGILKDLSTIINYKHWNKIVTHGPEGTTGHIHHKKTSEYVTKIVKHFNKYNYLFYFGKFYKNNTIPHYLQRINNKELELKTKEVQIYKSVRDTIYKLWFHMLPYENWVSASKLYKLY